MFSPVLVFASIFSACCLATSTFGATLAIDEVEALKSIGRTLGKTNWNFSVDPCSSGDESWANFAESNAYYVNNVTCVCSSIICHVVRIALKGQNLSGTLPPQLTRLPYLQDIDLTRNYLSGSIPPQWGSMQQLVQISLLGNRLTGLIPEELANMSSLTSLVLEHNSFSGNLPAALGNLPKIERLFLNSNNFTGELPETFARLTTLKIFRIGDNNFTGKIPGFIFQNWTNLKEIRTLASGLSGPIPDIGSSGNLEFLMITDLNGVESTFPRLSNLSKLEYLILRSCNLVGKLPTSLENMPKLETLDLSFNKLSGEIKISLPDVKQLFLTGNMFTGAVPQWILNTNRKIDLSYNKFTSTGGVDDCQKSGLNLFASTSRINNSGVVSCLGNLNCPVEPLHSFYINCGGKEETINNITYEADPDKVGTSTFYRSTTHWAFSSSGIFLDDHTEEDVLVLENKQLSSSIGQIYSNARLSPSSLTYYAFCLHNATYSVSLHFTEIQFTDGKNYGSLGRRIFDVYIQGKLELKDFNIKDEAGGAGKPILKNFTANVSDGTLEIRLQWTGKGTTVIPMRGVYGPLISAISVFDPVYKPQSESRGGISAVAKVAIVAAAAFATFLLVVGILWWSGCLRRRSTLERYLKGIELQTGSFTLRQIKDATNNFDAANKVGEGGFGPVYKGILADGKEIAVKQLSARSNQGNREFVTEIGMISAVQHPHLVKLYGCCIEGNQLMLIYEYLENNSLARALFGPEEFQLTLDWPTRRKICIGIARGLAYLHEESRLKIVHRDIKATNVLLDKNLDPKISDFGLAKLDEEDNTHISTRIAGTYGYMAPEYAMHGRLTDKADVYSFGIVALEIVSGTCNTKHNRVKTEYFYLLDVAHRLKQEGNLLDLIDPRVASHCNAGEAMVMVDVALSCTNPTAAARPSMSMVVSVLEGRASVSDILTDSSIYASKFDAKKLYGRVEGNDAENNSQVKSMLRDGCTDQFMPGPNNQRPKTQINHTPKLTQMAQYNWPKQPNDPIT
ncbi:probable leucine-rich repeat receptor-like serine/threonine-protein kinase At3g14840 isoform X2 [Gossypium raimondii]|uniref:probable leucine-rich repeat receptor-like serine/threonine-protein kinase At3g14840 isoform X2 n=1 Tax=Gossypium raimondii TaxID=29730 RepID=UPI00063ACEDD|nr:probable leucine-rich repeat receptor-like serine/threonine-protein kinase At3g14840 isoform X2 [Gossypium raimondii]